MNEVKFEFGGYTATVISPEKPNGKWIWKTEFLHAFEDAELKLLEMGYTRVTYGIHNMWGSWRAVRLMHAFHDHVVKEFSLSEKCILFGFSRGGTYAFNYALTYPEKVEKVYLDAPVLDLGSITNADRLLVEIYNEYSLDKVSVEAHKDSPVRNLDEFFKNGIPLLIIAGDSDDIVPYDKNAKKLIDFCEENGIKITSIVKPGCKHHPHSVSDLTPIIDFIEG